MLLALVVGGRARHARGAAPEQRLDYAVMAVAMTGISIPNFVVAPLLILVFGVLLGWLPVGGWGGGDSAHVLPVVALPCPRSPTSRG